MSFKKHINKQNKKNIQQTQNNSTKQDIKNDGEKTKDVLGNKKISNEIDANKKIVTKTESNVQKCDKEKDATNDILVNNNIEKNESVDENKNIAVKCTDQTVKTQKIDDKSQKAPVARKKGPNLADIKRALAEKQKAKEIAEKDAKEREKILNKEKEKKEKEIVKKIEKMEIKKEGNKVTSKLPRFTFLRKDVTNNATEEQKDVGNELKNKQQNISATIKNEDTITNTLNDVKNDNMTNTIINKSPITCILGHVDTGKTKLLDKLRHTNVQLGEAGGITQQIGATFFPDTYLQINCKINTVFPGILIIDTPGHESFTNLRSRGSSLCNIAILVIDIMHSLEPQTLESIEMLKMRKTPFVIALNKIDRIYEWKNMNEINKKKEHMSTASTLYEFDISRQKKNAQLEFEQKLNDIMLALSEIGLNTALYSKNTDQSKIINIVPTSAMTGEGIPNLFSTILSLCEKYMTKKLTYDQNNFECTVLEVKNEEGHGITIDAILSNGELREGDKICLCGFEGPIITSVKTILVPEACKESRTKSILVSVKKVTGSLGIKIAATNLEKVVCGTSIVKINTIRTSEKNTNNTDMNKKHQDSNINTGIYTENIAKKMVMDELNSVLNSIKTEEIGVHIQASTLGSLEALLNFLKTKYLLVLSALEM
ncbi:eukaryotic translation initiation factor 5B [Binucleata daphniae]